MGKQTFDFIELVERGAVVALEVGIEPVAVGDIDRTEFVPDAGTLNEWQRRALGNKESKARHFSRTFASAPQRQQPDRLARVIQYRAAGVSVGRRRRGLKNGIAIRACASSRNLAIGNR